MGCRATRSSVTSPSLTTPAETLPPRQVTFPVRVGVGRGIFYLLLGVALTWPSTNHGGRCPDHPRPMIQVRKQVLRGLLLCTCR